MQHVCCDNPHCEYQQTFFNGMGMCGLPRPPVLSHWSEDMHPDIMICMDFKKGETDYKEIRDEKGYYPGQRKEPS